MSDELKRKILEIYLENTEKGRTSGNWYHTVAESLEEDNSIIESLGNDLEDEKCLEKETMRLKNNKVLFTGIRSALPYFSIEKFSKFLIRYIILS